MENKFGFYAERVEKKKTKPNSYILCKFHFSVKNRQTST